MSGHTRTGKRKKRPCKLTNLVMADNQLGYLSGYGLAAFIKNNNRCAFTVSRVVSVQCRLVTVGVIMPLVISPLPPIPPISPSPLLSLLPLLPPTPPPSYPSSLLSLLSLLPPSSLTPLIPPLPPSSLLSLPLPHVSNLSHQS